MSMENLREEMLKKKFIDSYENDENEESSLRKRVWEESKKIWKVAGPATFTRLSTFGIFIISQAFIGHIGSTELAAYALVTSVLNKFVIGILVSLLFFFLILFCELC